MNPNQTAAAPAPVNLSAEQLQQVAPLIAKAMIEQTRAAPPPAPAYVAGPSAPEAPAERHDVHVGRHMRDGTGLHLVRWAKARAVAVMQLRPVEAVLKDWHDEVIIKALAQSTFTAGGSTVLPQFAQEFIELLRNVTVVRKAGARQVPMPNGSLIFNRQTGAGTAYYGQENTAITSSQQATDQLVLSEKKLTALTAVSNDLIRNASISAEEFVRDDLLRIMGIREDLAFLYGTGAAGEPTGLKTQVAAGNKLTMLALASAGKPTVGEAKKEFNRVLKTLKKGNAPMQKVAWFMSPSPEQAICDATGPGGDGTNVLEREMSDKGTIRGKPFFVTNQIAEAVTTDIFGVDMSEVIIGDSLTLEVEVFPNGTWASGATINSGISNDQTVLRALSKHDIGLRHTVSGVVVSGVTWGI